uniref:Post-GPI attachment to proteins factor 2 n=1 Tax=Schistocephalus solidus TaxID=70667 RepID=A0A0V0J6F9_SCHSO
MKLEDVKLRHPFIVCAVPIPVLIGCVLYTIYENPVGLDRTHCAIPNYIPSVSAATGVGYRKLFWTVSISLSCIIRVFLHIAYHHVLSDLFASGNCVNEQCSLGFHSCIHFTEILGLFLLTVFPSTESFPIHRNSFALFVTSSLLYGITDLYLLWRLRSLRVFESSVKKPLRRKRWTYVVMFISVFLATLFYFIHSTFCAKTSEFTFSKDGRPTTLTGLLVYEA